MCVSMYKYVYMLQTDELKNKRIINTIELFWVILWFPLIISKTKLEKLPDNASSWMQGERQACDGEACR